MQSDGSVSGMRRLMTRCCRHKVKIISTASLFIAGIVFWGAFTTALQATDSLEFCTSCHEMGDYVFQEYKTTIHYQNPVGVRAVCADCHVPHALIPLLIRKIEASSEVYNEIRGTISTPEKFAKHRFELAQNVWKVMKATDSRECRNCHSWTAMDIANQPPRARGMHTSGMKDGSTCIDCHKGVMDAKAAQQEKAAEPPPTSFDIQ